MGRGDPVGGSGGGLSRIRQLAAQLHENSNELKRSGRWTTSQASDHVKIHKQFEKAVGDMSAHQKGQKLSPDIDVVHILEESNELIELFQTSIDEGYQSGASRQGSQNVTTTTPVSPGASDETVESAGVYGMNQEEIEGTLRSLPSMTEKQLPKDVIEDSFEKELEGGSTLKDDLEKMITDLGLDIEEISSSEMKVLVSCLLIERNVQRTTTKEKAQFAIFETLLPYVSQKLKTEEGYDAKVSKYQEEVLTQSLITEETASTVDEESGLSIKDLMFLLSKIEDKKSPFFQALDEKISSLLTNRYSQICHQLKTLESPEANPEEIERNVTDAMGILNCLSKNLPVNEDIWIDLIQSFEEILRIRSGSHQTVKDIIAKVFQQFETFIEDGILTYLLLNGGGDAEQTSQRIYGRTTAEMEKIKARNRVAVATKIIELAEKIRGGAPITVEMLSELHRVNNKNIVPKIASEFRLDGEVSSLFGKRVGLIAEDIRPALEDIFERADQILKRDDGWGLVSYFTSSVEIAILHNEVLDIHPFVDRNGSTALLFAELMMAVKGEYTPSTKRDTNYYRNLSGILNSRVAAAVVATEHYKIAHVGGHYESRVIELTEEKRRRYAAMQV